MTDSLKSMVLLISIAYAAGICGLFANYLVKWSKNEIAGTLWCYLFHQNIRATTYSACALFASIAALIQFGAFEHAGALLAWKTIIYISAQTGYFLDSAINKGVRPEWTESERVLREKIAALDLSTTKGIP